MLLIQVSLNWTIIYGRCAIALRGLGYRFCRVYIDYTRIRDMLCEELPIPIRKILNVIHENRFCEFNSRFWTHMNVI